MSKKLALLAILSLVTMGFLISSCTSVYYQGEQSDHFDGERFFNPNVPEPDRGLLTFLRWRLFADEEERPEWPDNVPVKQFDKPPAQVVGKALRISYVGHASLLIQTQGINILTDPIWSERASPVSFYGPKRVTKPGINFADLPKIDAVIISHNHYDHLDKETIIRLWQTHKPRFIVPLGNDTIIKSFDNSIEVEAYDWGDKTEISNTQTIHLVPVHHWSTRGLFDRNKALWAGYVITTPNGNIYFGGDLGYGDGSNFTALKDKFSPIRFAALPIGAYKPRWYMQHHHLSPDDAASAFIALGARYGLGIHHGVFPLGGDYYTDAANDLIKANEQYGIKQHHLKTLEVGEYWLVPTIKP